MVAEQGSGSIHGLGERRFCEHGKVALPENSSVAGEQLCGGIHSRPRSPARERGRCLGRLASVRVWRGGCRPAGSSERAGSGFSVQFPRLRWGHGCSQAPARVCGAGRGGEARGGEAAAGPGRGTRGWRAAAAAARREGVKRRAAPSAAGCKQRSFSLSYLAAARSPSPEPGAVTRYAPDPGNLAAPGSAPHGHSEGAPRQGG